MCPSNGSSGSLRPAFPVLGGLVVLAVLVYGQVAGFAFVGMDDSRYLTENPWVQQGLSWQSLRWALTNTRVMYWHPVTWLSFMAEVEAFGVNPASAHLINLAIHVVNAFLVWRIARRLTGNGGASAFAAALFLVHPLQVESVAWVAERKTLLCALFAFLAVLAYLDLYAPRPTVWRYLAVTGLFTLAMGAKPAAAPLPAVLLVLDVWLLDRTGIRKRRWWPVAEKIPLFLAGVLLSRITLAGLEDAGVRVSGAFVPWASRWVEAAAAVGAFFGRAFAPVRLSFWYPVPADLSTTAWSGALLGTGLLLLAWGCSRKRPVIAVSILWYLLLIVPGLGLERGGMWPFAADRFQYLALPGLGLAVTEAGRAGLSSRPARRLCAAAALGTLAATTWIQTGHWRNGSSLFRYALSVEPRNIQALNELGVILAREGRLEEAVGLFRRALARFPCYLKARNNLALAWAERGYLDRALMEADAMLRCRPADGEGLRLKSRLLAELGRLDEAAGTCVRALERDPDNPDLLAELGRIRLRQGQGEEAATILEQALRKGAAERGAVLRDLGAALLLAGRNARAEWVLREALATSPADPDLLTNLGLAAARQGRCKEAEGYLLRALALAPGHPAARANLRRIRAAEGACAPPDGP